MKLRLAAAFLLLSSAALAAVDTSPNAVPPEDPNLRHGTLPNGMQYFVMRNEKPANRVELRLAVKVGSVQETEEERGIAHFNEHMEFNGSKNFKPGELIPYLESIGSRFGADSNAYTSYDQTVYQLQIPTDKPGALDKGLLVMSDWAGAATFSDEEINKERGVVLDELRRGKGAGKRIRDKQEQILYKGSRYADRNTIGLENVITGAPTDVVRGFYKKWYHPDVMAIFVIGDIDPAAMEAKVKDLFGAIAKPATETKPVEYPVPPTNETAYSIESDKELTNSSVQLIWKAAAAPTKTVGDLRSSYVRQVAAGLLSQRLDERAHSADPPFLGAGAGYFNRVKTLDTFTVSAGAKDGTLPVAAKALMEEVERASEHGFLQAELDRVKTSWLAGVESQYKESKDYRSEQRIDPMVGAFLDDNVVTSDEYDYELAKALIPGITLDEVNAAFRQMAGSKSRVVLVRAPDKEGAVPTEQQIRDAVEPKGGFAVAAYVDDLAGKKLIEGEPTPGTVVSRKEIPEVGASEILLSNGARIVLRPSDFRADQVIMTAFALEGASMFGKDGWRAALRADTLAGDSGLADFTAPQLSKWLQAQGVLASAGPGVSRFARRFDGSARPQDFETMVQLVNLYFTKPAFRDEAFQRMIDSETENLKNQLNSPGGVYSRAIDEELYRNHWLFRPDTLDDIAALKKDEIERDYRQMFDDASEWTFLFVGNIDEQKHLPLIEKWIGSLPTTSATPKVVEHPSWEKLDLWFPPGNRKRQVRKGIEDQARTMFTVSADARLDPQSEFEIDAATDLLEIKLRDKLREELGETYGVNAGYSAMTPYEGMGRIVVSWTSAPGPREQMMRIVKDTMRAMRDNMPTDLDVQKLREMRFKSLADAEKENGYWQGGLFRAYLLGRDPRTMLDYKKRVATITAPKLRDWIRKWFRLDDTLEVYLLPENWSLAEAQVKAEAPPAPTPNVDTGRKPAKPAEQTAGAPAGS